MPITNQNTVTYDVEIFANNVMLDTLQKIQADVSDVFRIFTTDRLNRWEFSICNNVRNDDISTPVNFVRYNVKYNYNGQLQLYGGWVSKNFEQDILLDVDLYLTSKDQFILKLEADIQLAVIFLHRASAIDANDIDLVIDQTHCYPDVAITALFNNNNDLVDAIMELTI